MCFTTIFFSKTLPQKADVAEKGYAADVDLSHSTSWPSHVRVWCTRPLLCTCQLKPPPPPPTPGKYEALKGVTKGFGTFLCPKGWEICCFLLRQFCPWSGGLVRFWHSWTSEDWGEWVVSMCFLIPKGGFKMDDIKVLCWCIFFPIELRAQELFIIVLKSIKKK